MIKKISYIVFVLAMLSSVSGFSQLKWKYGPKKDIEAKNSVYAEALGSGFLYSLNYERKLGNMALRVGLSYATEDFLYPVVLSYLYELPRKKLTLEYGAGVLVKKVHTERDYAASEIRPDTEFFPNLNIAARYQPGKRGMFLKLAFTPFFDLQSGKESYFSGQEGTIIPMFLWGGASFGVAF